MVKILFDVYEFNFIYLVYYEYILKCKEWLKLFSLWYNKGEYRRMKFIGYFIVLVDRFIDYLLIKIKNMRCRSSVKMF